VRDAPLQQLIFCYGWRLAAHAAAADEAGQALLLLLPVVSGTRGRAPGLGAAAAAAARWPQVSCAGDHARPAALRGLPSAPDSRTRRRGTALSVTQTRPRVQLGVPRQNRGCACKRTDVLPASLPACLPACLPVQSSQTCPA
jgi:hypothetical protein